MFEGLANLATLMQKAQQMRGMMQEINERLREQQVRGTAAGGMVEVEANGLGEITHVKIDPALFDKGEREMIEDLLPAAINAALAKAKETHTTALGELTEGLNVPGLGQILSQFRGDSKR